MIMTAEQLVEKVKEIALVIAKTGYNNLNKFLN